MRLSCCWSLGAALALAGAVGAAQPTVDGLLAKENTALPSPDHRTAWTTVILES